MASYIHVDQPTTFDLEAAGKIAGWLINDSGYEPTFLINGQRVEWHKTDRPDVKNAHPGRNSIGFEVSYGPFDGTGEVAIIVGDAKRLLRFEQIKGDVKFDPRFRHLDHRFGSPNELAREPLELRRVVLIASCQLDLLTSYVSSLHGAPQIERYVVGFASGLPPKLAHDPSEYAFQIVQIPAVAVIPVGPWFALDGSIEAANLFFLDCVARLDLIATSLLKYANEQQVPAFVLNFLVPQQNAMGRLLPRYDFGNPVYFFEKLNEALVALIERTPNAYLLDADCLSAQSGRRYFQDETTDHFLHNGLIVNYGSELDLLRLHPVPPISETFGSRPMAMIRAVWEEAVALNRTLRQADAVKLVVFDLDDTLWRGVLAEEADVSPDRTEGWPLGIIESITYLRRRGILVALLSKNNEAMASEIYEKVYGTYFPLSDFVTRKIDWRPKTDNMREILQETNILPRNAVFIDDNPVERAAMLASYPEIRVLGENQYLIRRILLYAPETQVALITDESARRLEMVRAQIVREEHRQKLSRDDFIKSLGVSVERLAISSPEHPHFARAFELLNKTNQFNSTGRRWSPLEIKELFGSGGRLEAFRVSDAYTNYGLVGCAIIRGATIEQFVMSCRVIGLDVEQSVLKELIAEIGPIDAMLVHTDANMPIRTLWAGLGFLKVGENMWRSASKS